MFFDECFFSLEAKFLWMVLVGLFFFAQDIQVCSLLGLTLLELEMEKDT